MFNVKYANSQRETITKLENELATLREQNEKLTNIVKDPEALQLNIKRFMLSEQINQVVRSLASTDELEAIGNYATLREQNDKLITQLAVAVKIEARDRFNFDTEVLDRIAELEKENEKLKEDNELLNYSCASYYNQLKDRYKIFTGDSTNLAQQPESEDK